MRRLSFRHRQYVILLIIAISPLIIAMSLSLVVGRNFIIGRTTRQLETVADLKTARIDQWTNVGREVAGLVTDLNMLGVDSATLLTPGNEPTQAAIELINDVHHAVQSISLLHPENGRVLFSTDPTQVGRVRQNESYFLPGQQALFINPVQYSVGREAPLLVISAPVWDEKGALLAVTAIEMNPVDLDSVIGDRSGLGQTGQAYLVETFGFYVTPPNNTANAPLRQIARSEGVERALAGENGSGIYFNPVGTRVVGIYRWLPEAKMGLLVEIEENELTREIERLWISAVLLTISLITMAIMAVRTLTNWLVTPLGEIVTATRRLQAGELNVRATHQGPDEVGQLAAAFNEMATSIQRSHGELEEQVAYRTADLEMVNSQLRQEISQRTQTEAALGRSMAEFEAIFNSISDAIIFTDSDRCIIMTNPAVQVLFGYTHEELHGKTTEIIYADKTDFADQGHHRYQIDAPEINRPYEMNYRRKDGTIFASETLGTQVRDANGAAIGFIGVVRDISDRKQTEEQVTRLGRILDDSLNELYIFDAESLHFIQVNRGAQKNLGYSMDELEHLTPVDLKPEFTTHSFSKLLKPLRTREIEQVQFTTVHQRKNHSLYPIEVHLQFFKSETTPVFMAVVLDITERMQAEQALHQRSNDLAALYEASQVLLGQINVGAILEKTCELAVERFGLKMAWVGLVVEGSFNVQPAVAKGFVEDYLDSIRVTWDDSPTGRGPTGTAIRTGQAAIANQIDNDPDYAPWRAAALAQGYHSSAALPLRHSKQVLGALNVYSPVADDFTPERIQILQSLANQAATAIENARLFAAERVARQQAQTLQAATQALSKTLDLPQVFELILSELQHVIPYDSATVQQIKGDQLEIIGGYGFPNLDELLGVCFDLKTGNNPNRVVVRTLAPYIVDNAPAQYKDFHKEPHAQAKIRSWLGVPLLFGDRLTGMLALDKKEPGFYTAKHAHQALAYAAQAAIAIENAQLVDRLHIHASELEQRVTERTHELTEANEQLQELDRLKSKFVSDVSHELRTPVTNLGLYLDLLEIGQPEQRSRYLDVLREQASRLQQLIEDILDLSRLEMARGMAIELVPVNLNSIVEQVVEVHRPRADAGSLDFVFIPGADLPLIHGEGNQLAQVVTNLVVNSLNYTSAGHIKVSTYLNPERSQVCLQVEDTGMGIAPEDVPHLFDRFYRGQNVSQSNIPGTGLGLGIVKEIAHLHKGEIAVQSEVGAGSIFQVWFPIPNEAEKS